MEARPDTFSIRLIGPAAWIHREAAGATSGSATTNGFSEHKTGLTGAWQEREWETLGWMSEGM